MTHELCTAAAILRESRLHDVLEADAICLTNSVPLLGRTEVDVVDGVEVHESFQYLVAYEQISLVFVDFVVLGKHHGQWAIEEVEDIMRNIYDENGQINPDYASEMLS